MTQRRRLNASRNIGFSATVSARALNVDSRIRSLSGFDSHAESGPAHGLKDADVLGGT